MFDNMWLLALYVWILFANHAWAADTTGMENDMIPDQNLQIPDGMFCYFTMSELMFEDRMQQVASSAYRIGAARLVDMKLISIISYGYENLWGAYYFVEREDYSNIIQYAKSRDYVAFVSTMEIETIENESGVCILTDVGLQPGTYPSTQDCSSCYGSGGSSDQPTSADYQQELASMGVPDSYFQTMGNLPSMQGSMGMPSAQMQGSMGMPSAQMQGSAGMPSAQMQGRSPSASLGASATGQTPSLGASAQGNFSPMSLGASATGLTPSLGASAQGNLSPTSLGASATGPTPSLGVSAQGNLPQPSGSNNQGQNTLYRHQLQSPYPQSMVPPPSTFSNSKTPTRAPSENQNVPPSSQLQPVSSPTGSVGGGFSGGVYQPQTNFSGGAGGGGNSQQSSLTPGFSFASYSQQYTFLNAQCGNSFMNYSQQ